MKNPLLKPSETVDQTQGSPEEMSKKPTKGSDVIQNSDLKKIWETIADLKTVVTKLSKNMNIKKAMKTIEVPATNSKKKCSQPKEKKKEAKNVCPKRGSLITSYFQTIKNTDSQNQIDNIIRITELENKVRKLENEKDQLRRQIADLTKENAELVQDRENLHQKCAKSTKPKQATVNTDMREKNSSKVKEGSTSKVKATETHKRTENKQEKENEQAENIQGEEGFRNNSGGRGKPLILVAGDSIWLKIYTAG